MDSLMLSHQPVWALNLIHYIEKPGSLRTFATSYKQIYADHSWHPIAVGAFGYGLGVRDILFELARRARFPQASGDYVVVIDVPPS